MTFNQNKTFSRKRTNKQEWYIVDASNRNLGRVCSQIAYLLMGKNKEEYLPYQEGTSMVIVINSRKIKVTGRKYEQKSYIRHSGRPGGLKVEKFSKLQKKVPNRIIEHAVRGMLPKNSLGRKLFKKLRVYSDNSHPHEAQKPQKLNIR